MKNMFLIVALFFAASVAVAGPVSYYGKLKARANAPFIDGEKTGVGNAVQLRGVSFGWTTTDWESARFYRTVAVDAMVNDWKAEVVRAAYGATSSPFSASAGVQNRARVETLVDAAIANDVYVIIDWHSHNAETEVENSKAFFEYMSNKYGSYDNVIFEIYNEPLQIPWSTIKNYANEIIPVIRAHSNNLILVGTPQWSQKIGDPASDKINDGNVGYVLHFYAYSHPLSNFQNNINTALNGNLPIFVTEYGTVHSDGGQSNTNPSHYDTHNAQNTDAWHSFMDEKKISSAAWEVNDKYAGACFFGIQGAAKQFDMVSWTDKSKMTPSGAYIYDKLNMYYQNAPWKNGNAPILHSANLPSFDQANAVVYSLSGKKIGTFAEANLKNGVYILVSKQNGVVQKRILKIAK